MQGVSGNTFDFQYYPPWVPIYRIDFPGKLLKIVVFLQYWPIYPCYSDKRPMVQCSVKYENDGISGNGGHMYDVATAEGHDVRRFV